MDHLLSLEEWRWISGSMASTPTPPLFSSCVSCGGRVGAEILRNNFWWSSSLACSCQKPHTERVRAAALSRRETLTWVSPCSGRGQRSRRCRFRADDAEQEVIWLCLLSRSLAHTLTAQGCLRLTDCRDAFHTAVEMYPRRSWGFFVFFSRLFLRRHFHSFVSVACLQWCGPDYSLESSCLELQVLHK